MENPIESTSLFRIGVFISVGCHVNTHLNDRFDSYPQLGFVMFVDDDPFPDGLPSAPSVGLTEVTGSLAEITPAYQPPLTGKEDSLPPPSYDEAMLPLGWETRQDQWGRTYYTDHNTKTTHWELPSATSPSAVIISVNPAPTAPIPSDIDPRPARANPSDARYDWSVLTPERMQAYAAKEWTEKDVDYVCCGCLSATSSTVCDDKLSCCLVVVFWAFIGLFIAGLVAKNEIITSYTAPGLTISVVVYFMYFLNVILPVYDCCGKRAETNISDLPRAAYVTDVQTDFIQINSHMTSLAASQPVLTLHVECYHMDPRGTYRHRTHQKTVKFKESIVIPIKSWRDVSPKPSDVCYYIHENGATYCYVKYALKYTLASEQKPLLDVLAAEYEKLHRNKDNMIRTWYTYSCPAYDEKRVDHVAKPCSLRYVLSRLWMNPFTFHFLLVLALYPVYVVGWKVFEKSYTVTNHKLLYLDRVNWAARDSTKSQG